MAAVFETSTPMEISTMPLPYIQTGARDSNAHPKGRRGKRYHWGVRDSLANRDTPGRPGSRRFQRYLNKAFLLNQSADLEANDFVITASSSSIFTEILGDGDKLATWEQFLDMNEHEQSEILFAVSEQVECWIDLSPEQNFNMIDKKLRRVLQLHLCSDFLSELEAEILQRISGEMTSLVYTFAEPWHRMICHGICQYYSLHSQSTDVKGGKRVVVVSKTKRTRIPAVSLSQHLKSL